MTTPRERFEAMTADEKLDLAERFTRYTEWQHGGEVGPGGMISFQDAEILVWLANRPEPEQPAGRPCAAGCGLAAAEGDIYCDGCGSAPDRASWAD